MLYLLFRLGEDRYAIEARWAVEVMPLVELQRTRHTTRGVAGWMNYRGRPVPAIDLSELTCGRPARELLSTRIILVEVPTSDSAVPEAANLELGTRNSILLGLIAERATELMRSDLPTEAARQPWELRSPGSCSPEPAAANFELGNPAHGLQTVATDYLGPVLMDGQGLVQLIQPQRLLTAEVRRALGQVVLEA